jgi:mannose-6-phosphate isomerase
LTPKFKDVDNLVNMLTYSTGGPSIDAGACVGESGDIIRYTPPVPEFEVVILHVDPGETLTYRNSGHPAILIILEGSGEMDGKLCRPGRSYYWPAHGDALNFTVSEERRGPMKVAVAHRNTNVERPTTVNRVDFGGESSHRISVPASPMVYRNIASRNPTKNQEPPADFFKNAMPTF